MAMTWDGGHTLQQGGVLGDVVVALLGPGGESSSGLPAEIEGVMEGWTLYGDLPSRE